MKAKMIYSNSDSAIIYKDGILTVTTPGEAIDLPMSPWKLMEISRKLLAVAQKEYLADCDQTLYLLNDIRIQAQMITLCGHKELINSSASDIIEKIDAEVAA
jgi:hypothetical protein